MAVHDGPEYALQEIKGLEHQQHRKRQEISDVEEEIEVKRDQLIEALEKRVKQKTLIHPLVGIHWSAM